MIAEFPKDGIKCLEKLKSYCANKTFADKSRYDRTFQQVTHKGGESAINYIKRFKNAQESSVSVGNKYSEDQIMHTFLDNFYQSEKYSAQLASHQAELRREEKYPDQKCLNISSFQTEYLKLDNSVSGSSSHNERAHSVQTKCTFCGLNNHSAEEESSKGSERKTKKLAQLVFHITEIRIVRLGNVIDADLKIILSQNIPSHIKTVRKDASRYILMKKVIVNATTAKMTMTIRYTHLWHECLVMMNEKVKSMVTVLN